MRTYLVRMPRCLHTEGAGQLAARRHALTYGVRVPASGVLCVPRTVAPQAASAWTCQINGMSGRVQQAVMSRQPQDVEASATTEAEKRRLKNKKKREGKEKKAAALASEGGGGEGGGGGGGEGGEGAAGQAGVRSVRGRGGPATKRRLAKLPFNRAAHKATNRVVLTSTLTPNP